MSNSKCDKCGEVAADIDTGFSPGLHAMGHDCGGTWRVATGPVLEECENNDCTGCPWCDENGITVPPLQAIANVIRRHNTDETFTADAEQVLEIIERILENAGAR